MTLRLLSFAVRSLAVALLLSTSAFVMRPELTAVACPVVLCVGVAMIVALGVCWHTRPSKTSLAATLDRIFQADEVLTTALYSCAHPELPKASVERVTEHAVILLNDVRAAHLLPARSKLHLLALVGSIAGATAAFAVAASQAHDKTTAAASGGHQPSNRLIRNATVNQWHQGPENEPPPISETLKLTEDLARRAEHAPDAHHTGQRARELAGFVTHHLADMRSDPSAHRVADYIAQTSDMGDLADAVRRGDWVRFDAVARKHGAGSASAAALSEVLIGARKVARAQRGAGAPGVVAKAVEEAIALLQAAATEQTSPPPSSVGKHPVPGAPLTDAERESALTAQHDGSSESPYPPGPLPRNDLAMNALSAAEEFAQRQAFDLSHRRAQLRSSELERLTQAARRHPTDVSPQRASSIEYGDQASVAVQQRQLNRALEGLRLMAGGDSLNSTVGVGDARAGQALAQGTSTPRLEGNSHGSDGEQQDKTSGSSPEASLTSAVPVQAQHARAPLHIESPLSAGLPGRHASAFGRVANAPFTEHSVHAPDRVLPLGHAPVPDEYRAQISRYFSPE